MPLLSGCSASPSDARASTSADTLPTAESSYVSDAVLGALSAWPAMQGRTWNVTHDNRFDDGWLLQTPMQPLLGSDGRADVSALSVPGACASSCDSDFGLQLCTTQDDCTGGGTCTALASSVDTPGGAARSMCTGHSDALYEEMYALLTSGTRFVDVTSLQPPDGRFEAAIRNALTYLSKSDSPPEVRLLFGDFPVQGAVDTKAVLQSLTRDVSPDSPIRIAVGAFRSSDLPASWNHAKIIAVDGKAAIVGGHNVWTKHYLGIDPVSDVSMKVRGSAAGDAHRFANVLWKYTCDTMSTLTWFTGSVWASQLESGSITSNCPAPYALPENEGDPTGTVIAVGRLGTGIEADGNQSDAARLAMIRSAKTVVRMSLQDIGPVKAPLLGIPLASWPDAEIAEIASAMQRNVDVYIVLSNLGAVAGGLSSTEAAYSNGWSLADVAAHIEGYMETHPGFAQGSDLTALLCAKLHLAPLRYSSDASWPDGATFANHAKTIAVDAQAFYIGSQNVYPAGLQEFGYIVDDSRATAAWLATYWTNVWNHSVPAAISGSDAPACSL